MRVPMKLLVKVCETYGTESRRFSAGCGTKEWIRAENISAEPPPVSSTLPGPSHFHFECSSSRFGAGYSLFTILGRLWPVVSHHTYILPPAHCLPSVCASPITADSISPYTRSISVAIYMTQLYCPLSLIRQIWDTDGVNHSTKEAGYLNVVSKLLVLSGSPNIYT